MEKVAALDRRLLEESLEELYENAPCGYVSTLPDGTFAKVNRTFLTWTGYTRDELLTGRRLQDLLTIPGKIYHETHYAPLLQMQGFVNEVALDLVCRDGRTLPVLVNTVQKRDAAGVPLIHRTTLFNATDRRQYERELLLARRKAEAAAQAKARFLSTVSHEIRTPLSTIMMVARLLEESDPPPPQRHLRALKSAAGSVLELVNEILDYSRIESGRVPLEPRPFDPRELIADVVSRLEPRAREKKLPLQVEIDEPVPPRVTGDPVKIGQVLTNLLGNAVKFTERGSVRLAVRVKDRRPDSVSLLFRVEDTGIGIPPERISQIFEEFTQATPEIASRFGGTGLGLAICRKLLELHGSEIAVESIPGQGSVFSFPLTLPVPGPEE